jgi:hypothetical protein
MCSCHLTRFERTLGQNEGLLQSPFGSQTPPPNKPLLQLSFFVIVHVAAAVLPPVQQAPEQNIVDLQASGLDDQVPPPLSQVSRSTLLLQR